MNTQNRNRPTNTKNKLMVAGWEGLGEKGEEQINRYKIVKGM